VFVPELVFEWEGGFCVCFVLVFLRYTGPTLIHKLRICVGAKIGDPRPLLLDLPFSLCRIFLPSFFFCLVFTRFVGELDIAGSGKTDRGRERVFSN
jgi:hypothetical protein